MVVYWEYAFLENFILDGLLLYLALKCAREKCYILNLLFAAAIGAVEAIVFPLLTLPVWAGYFIKFAGGALLVLLSIRKIKLKSYLIATAAFFLMTFALGGLLVAVYSFVGVEYAAGSGYFVERAPVALVLGVAGVFTVITVLAAKYLYRYRRMKRNLFSCSLTAGKKCIHITGFADSGNLLEFRNQPVSVISPITALALFRGNEKEVGRMTISTVNGGSEAPVFECEMEVTLGSKKILHKSAFVTVGDIHSKEYRIILHSAMLEGENEAFTTVTEVDRKDKVKRERRKLPLRK